MGAAPSVYVSVSVPSPPTQLATAPSMLHETLKPFADKIASFPPATRVAGQEGKVILSASRELGRHNYVPVSGKVSSSKVPVKLPCLISYVVRPCASTPKGIALIG